ncbi:GyrI-like domain-containing protein [Flavobacterium sp.]|uniref:GyrI-like domain-containing protein n=1 Tax=Flavobacterium sp. TaxID=239 RepID=UPI003D6C243E
MRIAKYLFLLLLLISGTISVFVATKDGNYTVEKTKIIDVPKDIVFKYVSDSKNWDNINPWKNEVTKINHIENVDGEKILQNISINNIESEMELSFKDTLNKKTAVTWTKKGTLNFKDKFLGLINRGTHHNFDKMFELGLSNLNAILTSEVNSFSIKDIAFVDRDTIFYIQRPLSCKAEELPAKIKAVLPKLNQLLKSTNTPSNGSPFIIYHSRDTIKNTITFSVAVPTKQKVFTTPESDIYTGQTNPFQAVKATLTGNYMHKKEALSKIFAFMEKNRLEQSPLHKEIEIIPVNSLNSNSAAKWTTEIYIPVRPKKLTIKVKTVKKDSINTVIDSYFNKEKKTS